MKGDCVSEGAEFSNSPILEERVEDSDALYIIFGGRGGKIAMPMFEFYQASQILNENRLFVRDLRQAWYQKGLPGISDNIDGTVEFLREKIAFYQPKKLFFVGNSMGGFAAYLFASLLDQGQVIAFSPQAFISPWKRFWHRDNRWNEQISAIHRTAKGRKVYYDLNRLPNEEGAMKADIYISSQDALDVVHANYFKRRSNVALHVYPEGGHGLVRHLRDTGELATILKPRQAMES